MLPERSAPGAHAPRGRCPEVAGQSRPSPTQSPTVNPLAGQITNGLVTDTPTLNGQSIDPAITGETVPTCGRVGPDCQPAAHRHRGAGHIYR